jgi:ACS family hexuronate transporter-like MFS transporter
VIVGLLFAAMVINYVDRQTIGLLKADLSKEFGWDETHYADLVFYFQLAYAVAYLAWGKIMDKIGARWGFGIAFLIWQIAHIGHALARGFGGFAVARMGLGIGEGRRLPGRHQGRGRVVPQEGTRPGHRHLQRRHQYRRHRHPAGGAGHRAGLRLADGLHRHGRRRPGLAADLADRLSPSARAEAPVGRRTGHIEQDPADPVEKIGWAKLLTKRETWAFALGKFLIDPIWWMFLFWLPDFLGKRYGLDLKTFGPPLIAIYLLSDVGSVGGGWLSSNFMKMGWSINKARKITMLICALLAMPVMFAANVDSLWLAVLIIGVATAAHQGFSANLYTLPSDVFPRGAVGLGRRHRRHAGRLRRHGVLQVHRPGPGQIGTYTPIFIVAGSAYLVALLVIHLLTPKMEPVKV